MRRTVTIKLTAHDWEIEEPTKFLERLLRVFLPEVDTEVTEGYEDEDSR